MAGRKLLQERVVSLITENGALRRHKNLIASAMIGV